MKNFSKNSIKNLIFDLGNVLIYIDTNATKEAFKNLGFREIEKPTEAIQQTLLAFERGEISPENFRKTLRGYARTGLTDAQIDTAWNALLKNYAIENLKLIAQLRENYRTFLLSNTNYIHWQHFRPRLEALRQRHQLPELFEREYYSHNLRSRKPEEAIYKQVLADAQIVPEETLFADDRPENLQAAQKLGIRPLHIHSPDELPGAIEALHPELKQNAFSPDK
mgnify:CR=1 FL=1